MRMLATIVGLLALIGATPGIAKEPEAIKLWPKGAPGSMGAMAAETTVDDPRFGRITRNVSDATLTAYLPDPKIATGTGIVIAPGGGFHLLSIDNEGNAVAAYLNSIGVAAFVLRYRLLPTGDDFAAVMIGRLMNFPSLRAAIQPVRPLATADGEAAMRYVRTHAKQYRLKRGRIGLMGFSAGGAVAMWTILADQRDSRPNFAVAMYAGLVGDPLVVPPKAPPLLAIVANDDPLVRPESDRIVAAWKAAGADATLVTYATGGHGFGMSKKGVASDAWPDRFKQWLQEKGLLGK